MSRVCSSMLVFIAISFGLLGGTCSPALPAIKIPFPFPQQLSLNGDVRVRVVVPLAADPANLVVNLDGNPLGMTATGNPRVLEAMVNVATGGPHTLTANDSALQAAAAIRVFHTADLENPDECELMNAASCLLPYPSSRFLIDDPSTPSGMRLSIPAVGLPSVNGPPIDPDLFNTDHVLDGFAPTVQILMHVPSAVGVDLPASGAARLIPEGSSVAKPYVGIRMTDDTSLQATSPTLLIHADSGQRILHWVELDDRAAGNPARQAILLRPGVALEPGERYIVAVRGLVDTLGAPLGAEPAFTALRDQNFTDIDALAARRAHYEDEIFAPLASAGVARNDLILAFDFSVASDASLTSQVISMRDQALAWLALQTQPTFTVDSIEENDCSLPGTETWRIVRGTYETPLYLSEDPEITFSFGVLVVDGNGVPVQNGVTNSVYTIGIPCTVNDPAPPVAHPVVLGHGLFGEGDGMVTGLAPVFSPLGYITGATNWRGLSDPDLLWIGLQVVGLSNSKLNNIPALVDRLKQGQINTQVLARMMKDGLFNADPAFHDDLGQGVFPGASAEQFYLGISLGGIMGAFFAALTDDVERFNIDVPAMNFGFLLQRSTQFSDFDTLLTNIGLTDPIEAVLGLGLIHELWVKGEPAGYVHRLADEVATGDKRLLMTVAWLDKQVSNQASEILARSLGLPNLTASVTQGFQGIPDLAGPLDSAMVIYDTGSFDIFDPAHVPFIPPLANQIPSPVCDPHGARPSIPASIDQVSSFLSPGGQVLNFCVGLCDGVQAEGETGGGNPACDPLGP